MSIKTDEDDRKNKLTTGKCAKWDEWDEDSEVPTWKTASLAHTGAKIQLPAIQPLNCWSVGQQGRHLTPGNDSMYHSG